MSHTQNVLNSLHMLKNYLKSGLINYTSEKGQRTRAKAFVIKAKLSKLIQNKLQNNDNDSS